MAGLIATPNITQSESSVQIGSDGWFPPLSLSEVRADRSFDGSVTTQRLRRAISFGISQVNRELSAWKSAEVQATGASNLAAVASDIVGDESVKVADYFRAVAAYAEADILESQRGYDLTAEGVRRAEMLDGRIGEARRNAFWAIQDIQGLPHTVSGLV